MKDNDAKFEARHLIEALRSGVSSHRLHGLQVRRGGVQASDPSFLPPEKDSEDEGAYETNVSHVDTFINSMRSRKDPNVPVEIGHSSCVVCTLGNIAHDLGRPIQWNPIVEKFVGNDAEATAKLHYQYRPGYSL